MRVTAHAGSAGFWPENFPDCWRYMELRRHYCGEILAYDGFVGEWFHPVYLEHDRFASRSSGHGAICPGERCRKEIYLLDTEPISRETQPPLFS